MMTRSPSDGLAYRVVVPGDRAADAVGGLKMPFTFTMAHAQVPGHTVAVDTSDRLWIAARCTCGEDFSRRKWIKAARHVIEDVDQHHRFFSIFFLMQWMR